MDEVGEPWDRAAHASGHFPVGIPNPRQVGGGTDIAQCIFCEKEYAALINRVRNHVAGGGVGAKEAGVAKCPGTRRREGESEADHSLREAAFTKARDLCRDANAEAAKYIRRLEEPAEKMQWFCNIGYVRGRVMRCVCPSSDCIACACA